MAENKLPTFFINFPTKKPMIIGFESTKSLLSKAYNHQKLHHAILLQGKKGIGKSSFAKEFAAEILQNKSKINPDLLIIEKSAEKKEIGVDQIREIFNFSNQTSANSSNKFIIIDSACELNKSAANALLKILEEPKTNNFLILISHNTNRVLATIKSRCQVVKIPNLSEENFYRIIEQKNLYFSPHDSRFLFEICNQSPADLINNGKDLNRIYPLILRSILNKKLNDDLLKEVAAKSFDFSLIEKSYEFLLCRAEQSTKSSISNFFFEEEAVFKVILNKNSPSKLFFINDKIRSLLNKTNPLSLDKKLSLINAFNLMQS